MKIFVLADARTLLAFALAGLNGQAVTSDSEVPAILEGLSRETAGLILVTEALARNHREVIERLMMDPARPLIVEIPDINGPLPQQPRINERLISLMRR